MNAWPLALWGLMLITIEGVFLQLIGAQGWALQLGVVMVCYGALRLAFTPAAWLLLLWIGPIEWASAAPSGLMALGLVASFLGMRAVTAALEKRWSLGHAALCGAATLVLQLVMSAALLITRPDSPILMATLLTSLEAALITGAAAWPVGHLTERLGRLLAGRARAQDPWLGV